jgi:TonB family protein
MGTLPSGLEIMRKAFLATLALTPMLLHAQANTPAQTQSSANGPVLQSKVVAPKAFVASAATDGSKSTPAPARISTGVTAPKLISTVEIPSVNDFPRSFDNSNKTVVVSMIVQENGKPTDLAILRSGGAALDKNVLAAVSQYRFKPGTLDKQPTAVPVNLEITLVHPAQ